MTERDRELLETCLHEMRPDKPKPDLDDGVIILDIPTKKWEKGLQQEP